MEHETLCKVIDILIEHGMTEAEAIMTVGQLIEEEGPAVVRMMEEDRKRLN